MTIEIGIAQCDEAQAILDLQKRAFASEVLVYGCEIAPVCEPVEHLLRDMGDAVVLVARAVDGQVVGHVRGHQMDDGSVLVRRFCVDPDWQCQGIGGKLLVEVERRTSPTTYYWLQAGAKSPDNVAYYGRRGYVEVGREQKNENVTFVNMRKPVV